MSKLWRVARNKTVKPTGCLQVKLQCSCSSLVKPHLAVDQEHMKEVSVEHKYVNRKASLSLMSVKILVQV